MTQPATKSARAIPLFSAVAALMSLLTAAAGPFAQTVKVVRADAAATPDHSAPATGDFTLEISAIDLAPPPESTSGTTQKQSKSQPQTSSDKSAKIVQPLSGHWESAAQIDLPLADVPPAASFVLLAWSRVDTVAIPCAEISSTLQSPIKAGRAPPRL